MRLTAILFSPSSSSSSSASHMSSSSHSHHHHHPSPSDYSPLHRHSVPHSPSSNSTSSVHRRPSSSWLSLLDPSTLRWWLWGWGRKRSSVLPSSNSPSSSSSSSSWCGCIAVTTLLSCTFLLLWWSFSSPASSSACPPYLDPSTPPSPWCRLSSTSLWGFGWWPTSSSFTSSTSSPPSLLSHDDVHLSASFATACSSPSLCPFHSLQHLVIVAGHAVLTSLDFHNLTDDSQWELQSFQHGQLSTFLRHIEEGIKVAAADSTSLLLFSGGETRGRAGPRSEAQSYWMVAELQHWFQQGQQGRDWGEETTSTSPPSPSDAPWSVRSRTSTEEFARDSYENLLFSICRFHELTQRYPQRITVIGFTFKRERFTQLHRAAIRFPSWQFDYVGINPPSATTSTALEQHVAEQEHLNAFLPFSSDPFGCVPPLSTKRLQRNPFRRSHGYGHQSSCPELHSLLHFCGPEMFKGELPWDKEQAGG